MKKIYIDGDAGTTGLQIVEKLRAVSGLEIVSLPAEMRKDNASKKQIMATTDLVILCLPDEAAKQTVSLINEIDGRHPKILDASTAHRIAQGWVFGLPELGAKQEQAIRLADKVSNPGCYPTGSILLLKPLVDAAIIPPNFPITIHAISGYSGGGKSMITAFEGGAGHKFELYGLRLEHKHIPELQKYTGLSHRPIFLPSVGAFRQGMIDIIPLHMDCLSHAVVTSTDILTCLAECYEHCEYVRVVQDTSKPDRLVPGSLNGTNLIELQVHSNDKFNQVILTAHFDNLGKGAAGAAVQNLGLMLDIDVRNVLLPQT